MKAFANLFLSLDETNKTNEKVNILKEYLISVPDSDKMQMLALFTGRKPKRPINASLLKKWAIELCNLPEWLFDESYQVVGDLAETMSILMPASATGSSKTLTEWVAEINDIAKESEQARKTWLLNSWLSLDSQERFVFNKLLTGSFRVGVSQSLVIKSIFEVSGIDVPTLSHRLMGSWTVENLTYTALIGNQNAAEYNSRPYPFFLAYPIQESSEKQKNALEIEQVLGPANEWQAEWKWDGIRAQLIKRNGEIFIWSRGEDLATDKFPELHPFLNALPDGSVIDAELLCFSHNQPLPFSILQTRIGRKNLTKKILNECPVAIIAYDCLEYENQDIRKQSQSERRHVLEKLHATSLFPNIFNISPLIDFNSWQDLETIRLRSRAMIAEGLMLKRKTATYQVGRKRGDWWKWKIDPLTVDAVLIYAQKGHGRRADLFTDYTFAVWDGDKLVPFAKAYSGLTDEEIKKVDYFIKRNTLEKFGPVRTVKPELVFEIGFEGINKSSRHKSGIALRFPRILRWRLDKSKEEADTIESLRALL